MQSWWVKDVDAAIFSDSNQQADTTFSSLLSIQCLVAALCSVGKFFFFSRIILEVVWSAKNIAPFLCSQHNFILEQLVSDTVGEKYAIKH